MGELTQVWLANSNNNAVQRFFFLVKRLPYKTIVSKTLSRWALRKNTMQSLIKLEVNEKNCIVFGKENTYFCECKKVQTWY